MGVGFQNDVRNCGMLLKVLVGVKRRREYRRTFFWFGSTPPPFSRTFRKKTVEITVIEEASSIYYITIPLLCFHHIGIMRQFMQTIIHLRLK